MRKLLFVVAFLWCGTAFAELPKHEVRMIKEVAGWYRLSKEETALLMAIRKVEAGRPGKEFGVLKRKAMRHRDGVKSFYVQCRFAAETVKKRYDGDLLAFSKRWAPEGVANDPTRLNANWYRNAEYYHKQYMRKI